MLGSVCSRGKPPLSTKRSSCSASCRRVGIGLCASTYNYIRALSNHPITFDSKLINALLSNQKTPQDFLRHGDAARREPPRLRLRARGDGAYHGEDHGGLPTDTSASAATNWSSEEQSAHKVLEWHNQCGQVENVFKELKQGFG